ncbi:hypothetical protein EV14_0128 [Prochlorococcus sp. MIT 0703]|nr:hypothetical protein EV12_1406 [Prochlorococcus sp. MIT 0701]KGG37185.1 hypothetical protein EV14_0128 [Prochlorococcus sp. MIT 0703]
MKESRGQHPQTQNHSFKTITAFNTDYNNTELLDQKLNFDELQEVNGGVLQIFWLLQIPGIIADTQNIENQRYVDKRTHGNTAPPGWETLVTDPLDS